MEFSLLIESVSGSGIEDKSLEISSSLGAKLDRSNMSGGGSLSELHISPPSVDKPSSTMSRCSDFGEDLKEFHCQKAVKNSYSL